MAVVPYDWDMGELRTPHLREMLSDLPYLVAIAETGGVTAAADELGVPSRRVSRAAARLAGRVGAPMLVRSGRGIELSPEALEFLPYAQRAVAAVGFAGAGTRRAGRGPRSGTAQRRSRSRAPSGGPSSLPCSGRC